MNCTHYKHWWRLALLGTLVASSLPVAAASPFRNTVNTPFRTRCNGPQGALLAPAEGMGVSAMAATSVMTRQHSIARLTRAALPLRVLQAHRLKSPRAEARFPRMMYRTDTSGRLVLPALATAQQTSTPIGDDLNELNFEYSGFSDADKQVLQSYLAAAYPKMKQVYGPPAFNMTVTILQDSGVQTIQGGYYDVSAKTIHIPPLSGFAADRPEETFTLCLLILHAFRGDVALYYDAWEEGMAGAAATVVQTMPGVSSGYDPVNPGTYYSWSVYEAENQPGLSNSTFYPDSSLGMLYYRICMARTVWLKCWAEDPNFFGNFNRAYYAAYNSSLPGDVPGLKDVVASILPTVEGMSWYDWFQRQYILDTSVHTGLKLFTWNAPVALDSSGSNSVILMAEHYLTGVDGDESPRGGTASVIYWNFDHTLSLYVEPSDTQIVISDTTGEGFIEPPFTSIGDAQQVTVQIDLNGLRGMYPYPYNERGDNPGDNDFYGALTGGPSGSLNVSGAYNSTNLSASRGVFGACISGSRLKPGKITVQVTNSQSQVTSRTINVGWDSYFAIMPGGGGQAGLTHTWSKGTVLMSLPVTPLQTNAATLLGLDARTLLLARWDPTALPSGAYHIWPVIEPFEPGKAYWLKLSSDLTINNVQGLLPDTTQEYPVAISLGWNMVGSPRQSSVDVSDLKVQAGTQPDGSPSPPITFTEALNRGFVQKGFYAYVPGVGYQLATTLTPFDGFWLRCLVPGGMRLIFPAVTP